jgi:hypothetical protein
MTRLFLDDIRYPKNCTSYMLSRDSRAKEYGERWEIVRNYQEFVDWITVNGLPDLISFDHDLAPEHYAPQDRWNDYDKWLEESPIEKTGMSCAHWLTEYCQKHDLKLPEWMVHSMNPIGTKNITNLLTRYGKKQSEA